MSAMSIPSLQEMSVLNNGTRMNHLLSHPLMSKDIWHVVDDLGLKTNQHIRRYKINFSRFPQEWFKEVAKIYILYCTIQGKASGTLIGETSNIECFAKFLESQFISNFSQIRDEIFDLFFAKRQQAVSLSTYYKEITVIRAFFEIGTKQEWFNIPTYWFVGKRKFVVPEKIEFIPEKVWNQLDKNLHKLPEQLQRMVVLIRTKGMRGGELLQMPFDCLRQKKNGDWEIHFINSKFNRTPEEMDILPELAAIIQEQQDYIRKHVGEEFKYLFCSSRKTKDFSPASRVMSLECFNKYLNRLAVECEIRDESGQVWHFASHQFRRTVATILANSGIRDYLVQCYLRHRSPDMKRHYVHLFPQTLQREIEELRKERKLVDITGKVVKKYRPSNEMTELLRRKLYPRSLNVGECHRPIVKAPCLTTNACWRCEHYRVTEDDLPFLKADLPRIQEAIVESEQIGRVRGLLELKKDEAFLIKSIEILEASDD